MNKLRYISPRGNETLMVRKNLRTDIYGKESGIIGELICDYVVFEENQPTIQFIATSDFLIAKLNFLSIASPKAIIDYEYDLRLREV